MDALSSAREILEIKQKAYTDEVLTHKLVEMKASLSSLKHAEKALEQSIHVIEAYLNKGK